MLRISRRMHAQFGLAVSIKGDMRWMQCVFGLHAQPQRQRDCKYGAQRQTRAVSRGVCEELTGWLGDLPPWSALGG
jgi:hypothetical protein